MKIIFTILFALMLVINCTNHSIKKIYRDDGSLLAKGKIDDKGYKQGQFEYFDNKGDLWRIFNYINDTLQGDGLDFYNKDKIKSKYQFMDGRATFVEHFDVFGNITYEERGILLEPLIDTLNYGDLYKTTIKLLGPPLKDSVTVFSFFGGEDIGPIYYRYKHGIRVCGKMGSNNSFVLVDTPYMTGRYIQNIMINYNFQDSFYFQAKDYLYVKDTISGRSKTNSMARWAIDANNIYELERNLE